MNKRCSGLTFNSLVVLLALSALSEAAVYKVNNAGQLQSALTDSQYNGEHDTIRLAQGNYVGNFIYSSHADEDLTLEGGWNSVFSSREAIGENTVLDGNKTGNTFVFSCDKAANLTIDSITFQNGLIQTGKEGSGVYISIIGYDWVLENNFIRIENSIIRNNSANVTTHASGIGIYIWTHADVVIKNNKITGNQPTAESYDGSSISGGGIYLATSETVDIRNNTITHNRAGSGGGLYLDTHYLQVRIVGNIIDSNSAGYAGGGLYADTPGLDMPTIISGNIFSNNSSARYGGGIFLRASGEHYIISNNQITGNTSAWTGGGLTIRSYPFTNYYQSIDFINNTISYNRAGRNGGGLETMMQEDHVTHNIYNNIFWKNTSANPGFDLYLENDSDDNFLSGLINLYNNNFNQSGWGIVQDVPFPIHSSNLSLKDPLFTAAFQGDYTLTASSPCRNSGTNEAPNLPITDRLGSKRIQEGVVDMGAYEGFTITTTPLRSIFAPLHLLLQ